MPTAIPHHHTLHCNDKCCKLEYIEYDQTVADAIFRDYQSAGRRHDRKAGVCIYNSVRGSMLIVQSRGKLWGFPKGTVERNEEPMACALREVREETGIDLDASALTKPFIVRESVYYFHDTMYEIGAIPDDAGSYDNDVTGLGWIKINCLHDMAMRGVIQLNCHTKIILKKHMKLNCYPRK